MSGPHRLADATTMRVGGEVARWIEATTREEVAAAYAEALADDHEPLLLLGGALGDHYGRKRLLIGGTGLFAAASLLCATDTTSAPFADRQLATVIPFEL